jgi:pimeloyl-ACP methyl ester carboxylesterase
VTTGTTSVTGGLKVHIHGHGDRTVLVLHGLGADHQQPLSLLPPDLDRWCRIIAPDMRAHGTTELPADAAFLTFTQLATDVEEALAGLDIHDLTVIGISMGAAIALELLARARMPIRTVALVRPAWHWQPLPANLDVFPRIAELLRDKGADDGREAFQHSSDYAQIAAVSSKAADALIAQFDAPRARERVDRLTAIPASAPRRPDRPGMPILIVASTLDPVHPIATAEALANDLDADLRLVAPRYEQPDIHMVDLHRELQLFLERP